MNMLTFLNSHSDIILLFLSISANAGKASNDPETDKCSNKNQHYSS